MELRHLRYFMAAAEEEHFGRASDRLYVTRPAVSQIIADLESELGTPLFERLAHRVKLTAAGRALLPQIQSVMANLEDALEMARRVGQGRSGSLNIGYGSLTLLHSLFRDAIKQFHEQYPDVGLSLVELSTSDQSRALADGRIHAGFMHFGPTYSLQRKQRADGVSGQDEAVLDWHEIQTGGLGVAVPTDHRFAKRQSLSIAELKGEPLVVIPRSSVSPGYGPVHALCQQSGFEPRIVQEVQSTSSLLNLISVGLGVGMVVISKGFAYPSNLCVIPLEDVQYPTTFVLGWVKGQKEPALERLLEIVKSLAH
jgi:DNA-binding transcriptional LysR family regulator